MNDNDEQDIFLKPEMPREYNSVPIDWKKAINDRMDKKDWETLLSDLNMTQKGVAIHNWLEAEFGDIDWLRFEEDVNYEDEFGNIRTATYDCYDGDFVYEFKTKHPNVIDKSELDGSVLPKDDDMSQLNRYLNGTDTEFGLIVYIGRDDFRIEEYLIEQAPVGHYGDYK